jgi:hypothetical protein
VIQPIVPSKNGKLLAVTCLLGLPLYAVNFYAQAQEQPPLSAQVQSLDRVQAEQERLKKLLAGKPKAYEDNFMGAETLSSMRLNDGDEAPTSENSGFRSYIAESRMGYASRDGTGMDAQRGSEIGLRTEYRFETLNYGEFAIQADVRSRQGENDTNLSSFGLSDKKTNGRLTLRNYGFPITSNTFADTSLGDISSETTDALSRNYRFSLGNSTVRGASSHVFNREFDLRAGIGEMGSLVGGPYPSFEKTQGNLAWLGYSQRLSDQLYAGIQLKHSQNVPIQISDLGSANAANGNTALTLNNLENVTSLATSVGYGYALNNDGDKKARLTLLSSRTTARIEGRNNAANGIYLEGGFKSGRFRNEFGAYLTDANLRLGELATGPDTRGAYWRVDHSSSRLNWGVGLDYELQNTQPLVNQAPSKRAAINANVQQWIDRDSSIGAYAYASDFNYANNSNTGSKYAGYGNKTYVGSVNYQTSISDWGRSRITASMRRNQALVTNGVAATGEDIAWEHDWVTGKYETMRPEFTTTLGYARDRSESETQTYPTAGVSFRYWPDADWNIGGNINYTSRTGNLATSRGLYGSLNTERQIGKAWRLGATISLNQAVVNTTAAALNSPNLSRSNDKSFFIYLRYEGSNGTPLQTLGLSNPGATGGGSVTGVVFFDANRDSAQQAGESGVPNVEVLLDKHYRVTTDKDGRFTFPLVSTGAHQLSLRLESVPLPWGANQDQVTLVNVPLRGTADTKLPVVRVGE